MPARTPTTRSITRTYIFWSARPDAWRTTASWKRKSSSWRPISPRRRRAAGKIDFLAVVQHYTTWSDERFRRPNNPTLVRLEEDMLVRYGVDLLVNGHDHGYQRSVPFAFGVPDPTGYVQVATGVGGAP